MTETKTRQMKPSGVPWLGDIPAGWEFPRIHSLFFEVNEKYSPTQDGEMPLLSVSEYYGVAPRADKIDEDAILVRAESLDGYKKCQKGDIIINIMLAWKNALGVAPCSGIVSPAYCVYRSRKELDARYFHHLFRTKRYGDVFRTVSTGIIDSRLRLYTDKFFSIHAPFPPLPEQRAIADFLDGKCAAIDAIVEEAKAGIEEYAKWKQSVVFQAVTKGLDPHAKMKDSGVEWIGEIPEEWKVCKTLFALQMPITDGPHTTPELFAEGVPFVSAEAVSAGNGTIDFSHIRGYISEEFYQECCLKYIPRMDDIYMIKSGATTGRVAIVDTERKFTIWSPLAVFRANPQRALPRFLFYFLQSDLYQKQVSLAWNFGTQQNIGMRALERLILLLPPLPEQRAIAAYLDEKCSAIDALIEEKKQLIEDLGVYKKSLIYETVTGKRKIA